MTTYFTSDTHFGHRNILTHSNRPFASVEMMDLHLITNWNIWVKPEDTVWFLGDFTLANAAAADAYLKRLNGKIHLIWGNHDRKSIRELPRWKSSQYAAEICVEGVSLILCHYSMRVWNHAHHGALMLYGHSHGDLPGNDRSLDVGVDSWGYRPVALPLILNRMATLPPLKFEDHHRP